MSNYVQINNNHSATTANYTAKQRSAGTGGGFDDVLKAQEDKGAQPQSANTQPEGKEATDYMEQFQEHMAQMLDNIKHGTIQPKIQIGAQEYTQEEWKKLLEKFDEAEEELIEQVEEEIKARVEQCEEERAMMEALAKSEMIKETEKAVDSPI